MPMPWGQTLEHPVRPLQLLGLPLAFTQNGLLSPDDFVKRAGDRGVQIRPEHLLELQPQAGARPAASYRAAPAAATRARSGRGERRGWLWSVPESAGPGEPD